MTVHQAPRFTLAGEVRLEGLGLHSGDPVEVTLRPGDRGIWFRYRGMEVPAHADQVTETSRCTRLGEISTIEHLMSALAGLEITDAEIEVSAPELPALDGSSAEYVAAIREVGSQACGTLSVEGPYARVYLKEEDFKLAIGSGEGHWRYHFECAGRWPESQEVEFSEVTKAYEAEIAPARTFGFQSEIPVLLEAGFARGLDLERALVLGDQGYLNAERFADEPARHKLLDLVGDLYLAGVPIRLLNVVAHRSGHRANVHAANLLAQSVRITREN